MKFRVSVLLEEVKREVGDGAWVKPLILEDEAVPMLPILLYKV